MRERFGYNTLYPTLEPRVHSFSPHIQPTTIFPASTIMLHIEEQRNECTRQASAMLGCQCVMRWRNTRGYGKSSQGISDMS